MSDIPFLTTPKKGKSPVPDLYRHGVGGCVPISVASRGSLGQVEERPSTSKSSEVLQKLVEN